MDATDAKTRRPPVPRPRGAGLSRGDQLLFLTDAQLRQGVELMFFAYRDMISDADRVLEGYGYGRAHHRCLHFVWRRPGMSVSELLDLLKVTKQSLNRVLRQLVEDGMIRSCVGEADRRQRLLTLTPEGEALARSLAAAQNARMRRVFMEAGAEAVQGFKTVLAGMIDESAREEVLALVEDQGDAVTAQAPEARVPEAGGEAGGEATAPPEAHILVVDDDARIRELLKRYLSRSGFYVTAARDAAQARRLLEGLAFDLLVVDVMMPGEDGVAFTRDIRPALDTPVLLLTARGGAEDRIAGLESGADDYLPKPFEPRELLLRIGAILRRTQAAETAADAPRTLSLGAVRYDVGRGELWRGEAPIRLTTTESALMRVFARHPHEPVDRRRLLAELDDAQERAVDVQVTRLRRKIEEDPRAPRYLQTVRGSGYMLAPD